MRNLRSERTKKVEITNDDLIRYSTTQEILTGIEGFVLGYLGLTIIWVAIGLAYPIVFEIPNSLLLVVFPGSLMLAAIGRLRNRIVRRIADRGLSWIYWIQRIFSWLFWVGVLLAIYAILAVEHLIPEYSIPFSVLLAGSYFLVAAPRFLFGQLVPELREARLCMLQFLSDWNLGSPRFHTGHNWLRRSLGGVERQLATFGLSTSPGTLFLGSSYSLFEGMISAFELEALGDWLIRPADWTFVNWTIPFAISQAEEAERSGFGRVLGQLERLLDRPSRRAKVVLGTIISALTIIANLPSIIQAVQILAKLFGSK